MSSACGFPRAANQYIGAPRGCADVFQWLKAEINSLLDPRSFPVASSDWELCKERYNQSLFWGPISDFDLDSEDELFWLQEEERHAYQGVHFYWELSALCVVLQQLGQWKTLRKINGLLEQYSLEATDSPFNGKWGDVWCKTLQIVERKILKSLPPPFTQI